MPDASPPPSFYSPANLLTLARLFLLPVAVYGVAEQQAWVAVAALAAAGLTDLADGLVARRQGPLDPRGRLLDTGVDFTFIFGLFLAFYVAGWIPAYQFLLLYFAKLAVFLLQAATLVARQMQPLGTHLSKIAGALAYGYLLLLVARLLLPALEPLATAQAIVFAVLLVAVVLNGVECGVGVCRRG